MLTSFSTAVSAMNAEAAGIDVVGSNLANLNTVGYKTVSTRFSDLVSQSMNGGGLQVGTGVQASTRRNFTQGAIQAGGSMTAAINGPGFFVLQDPSNAHGYLYTRDGEFKIDKNGYLTDMDGANVLGADGKPILVDTGAAAAPVATSKISADFNLNSDAAVGDTFSVPIQLVDSLGATHELTITLKKSSTTDWTYTAAVPGSTVTGNGTLTFDSAGKLVLTGTPPVTTATFGITGQNGAAAATVPWNLADATGTPVITQYARTGKITSTEQDGYQSSELSEITMGDDGYVLGTYADGRQQKLGQVGIATISNPDSLLAVGSNDYRGMANTVTSGPGIPDPGSIKGGKTEASTVDIATEFTNMMVFERGYQAASKIITTSDTIVQETINLIR